MEPEFGLDAVVTEKRLVDGVWVIEKYTLYAISLVDRVSKKHGTYPFTSVRRKRDAQV